MRDRYKALDPAVRGAFVSASRAYGVPLVILLAIGWVETRWRHLEGDNGHSHTIMQINDKYHPRFANDDFRGGINYAAKHLRDLLRQRGSWEDAIISYNSGDACFEGKRVAACGRGRAYQAKVLASMASIRSALGDELAGLNAGPGVVAALGWFAPGSVGYAVVGGALAVLGGALLVRDPAGTRRKRSRRRGRRRWK